MTTKKKTTSRKPSKKLLTKVEMLGYMVRKWFFTGLLVIAPIAITLALIAAIISSTDSLIQHIIPTGYDPTIVGGNHIPGIGFIVTLVGLTIIGALISNFLGQYFVRVWDRMMARVPVINGVYGAIKQVLNSVLSEQGQSFREVVYVEFPQPGQYAVGFVVGPAEGFPVAQSAEPMMSVFIPMVPVPTSGFLLTLPQSKLIKSNMTVEEGLKLTVTLGLVKRGDVADTLSGAK